MPKRVIDFDAMWGSDKLAACAEWAQAEYAWLYGLADASGCFELTNLRVIWGRVAAIRKNLTIERLGQVLDEFQDKGLLFVWEHEGKRYGHWTGSDVPGRLPPPSWRMRLERFAPPVPKQRLAEYMSGFARGRAALAAAGFSGAPASRVSGPDRPSVSASQAGGVPRRGRGGLKAGLEGDQAQDLELDWNEELEGNGRGTGFGHAQRCTLPAARMQTPFQNSSSLDSNSESPSRTGTRREPGSDATQAPAEEFAPASPAWRKGRYAPSEKELALARDLRVGAGPVCPPGCVRPEAIERDRQRQAAQRAGQRGP